MIVLTRRTGEEIAIGERIRIVITAVAGDRVRLGICAPANVRVDRQEVYLRREHTPDTENVGHAANEQEKPHE
jgi:carbon storage regulator